MNFATVINTETGKETLVRVEKKTPAFAIVACRNEVTGNWFRGTGFSRRANGKWFPVGATRKGEKTTELVFRTPRAS